jgi:hypothetical protein
MRSRKAIGKGFKFLPVEYGPQLADYYSPASLNPADYPALIGADQTVPTIAVPTVLVSWWQPGTARYERVSRFVRELFTHLDKLHSPGFDPKWKGGRSRRRRTGACAIPPRPGMAGQQTR